MAADAYPTAGDDTASVRNAVFCVRPFHWGEDERIEGLANFEHYPTGLKITWYKYALRSGRANQEITLDGLETIFESCRASLGAGFDGGRPAADLVGTVTDMRVRPGGTVIRVRRDDGPIERVYLPAMTAYHPNLRHGERWPS